VDVEKLKYEIEIDSSSLGPQLALAQTQIGVALGTAGAGRPVGGIGIGPEMSAIGGQGNLPMQQMAYFAQGPPGMVAQQYSQPPMGPARAGFASEVAVSPLGMLTGGAVGISAAPWATAETVQRAVSAAQADFAKTVGLQVGADALGFGTGGLLATAMFSGSKILGFAGGIAGGMILSELMMGGVQAVRETSRWENLYAGMGAPDLGARSAEMLGYSGGGIGTFAQGVLEGIPLVGGLFTRARAGRLAENYGLRSWEAGTDPSFMLREGAYAERMGVTNYGWGSGPEQLVGNARMVDALMSGGRMGAEEAREYGVGLLRGGATIASITGAFSLPETGAFLTALRAPGSGMTSGAVMAFLATESSRLGRDPARFLQGGDMGTYQSRGLTQRLSYSMAFQEGKFGEPIGLTNQGITPNDVMSDLTTVGGFAIHGPVGTGIAAAIFGQVGADKRDIHAIAATLNDLVSGNVSAALDVGLGAISGEENGMRFELFQGALAKYVKDDPGIAAGVIQTGELLLQQRFGLSSAQAALRMEYFGYKMGMTQGQYLAAKTYVGDFTASQRADMAGTAEEIWKNPGIVIGSRESVGKHGVRISRGALGRLRMVAIQDPSILEKEGLTKKEIQSIYDISWSGGIGQFAPAAWSPYSEEETFGAYKSAAKKLGVTIEQSGAGNFFSGEFEEAYPLRSDTSKITDPRTLRRVVNASYKMKSLEDIADLVSADPDWEKKIWTPSYLGSRPQQADIGTWVKSFGQLFVGEDRKNFIEELKSKETKKMSYDLSVSKIASYTQGPMSLFNQLSDLTEKIAQYYENELSQ